MFKATLLLCFSTILGCGVYTFTGSTLPAYLKTVSVPLFANQSLKPGVAEAITTELSNRIDADRNLTLTTKIPDATFSGVVLIYSNKPYTYDTKSIRNVDVESYVVTIVVDIDFYDNKKKKILYAGKVTAEGIYDFKNEVEDNGRTRAIGKIIDQIMLNSVQQW